MFWVYNIGIDRGELKWALVNMWTNTKKYQAKHFAEIAV